MHSEPKVLIIDADPEKGKELQAVINFLDYAPLLVSDCARWKELAGDCSGFLAVLIGCCDVESRLSEIVSEIHAVDAHLPIYLLSAKGKEATITIDPGSCILGHLDLPPNYSQLTSALHQAEVYVESHRSETATQRPVELFRSLVGSSRAVQNVRKMIQQVAESDANVLILGESGTGKELVARGIHFASPRQDKPLIPVNCGSIPEALLESELFGHVKGAFTGADRDHKGLFEVAEGGTIFLDEIGELPLSLQVKILRVLQENEIRPVGSTVTSKVDVRVIAATSKNLEDAINQGLFREDLFFRLNVMPIKMPPLRDQPEDIPPLCHYFIERLNDKLDLSVKGVAPQAMARLIGQQWPGNVRELENILESAIAFSDDNSITTQDLHLKPVTNSVEPMDLAGQERKSITQALEKARWNKTAAARLLGLSLRQLRYRLQKMNIE